MHSFHNDRRTFILSSVQSRMTRPTGASSSATLPSHADPRVCPDTNQFNQLVQHSQLRHALPLPQYFRVLNTIHVRPIFQGSCCNPERFLTSESWHLHCSRGATPGALPTTRTSSPTTPAGPATRCGALSRAHNLLRNHGRRGFEGFHFVYGR